jgi:hypothetical protein
LKWDAVGSILKQALKLKSHYSSRYLVFFAAGALGDSIRFGIFVVYQFINKQ